MPNSFARDYGVTERAIEQAIEERIGSAGFFQRIVEQAACGLYPELADQLVPLGRNPNDKTVRAWPDAYLQLEGGVFIAVEATTAQDAFPHWHEDLRKLEERLTASQRGGFIWACWSNEPKLGIVAEMQAQVAALGVPAGRIHIFFRRSLCHQLREPRHARLWGRELGLPVLVWPFAPIEQVQQLYGRPGSTHIVPTAEEYAAGLVHTPHVLGEVEAALVERQGALVSGHGASGKSTLAVLLSQRPAFRQGMTYYLDLTGMQTDSEMVRFAIDAITVFGDRGTKFVIDNAHLAPDIASDIVRLWKQRNTGSRLLLLARKVRRQQVSWRVNPELSDLDLAPFDLVIDAADLEGVFRRLYRRERGADPEPVPIMRLAEWHALFGGDLFAFSAAVLGRLRHRRWMLDLCVEDARDYIRSEYIEHRDLRSETDQLLDLAAVGEKEIPLPMEAIPNAGLDHCIERGIVWVETKQRHSRYTFFRLVHPGLARLLLAAAEKGADEVLEMRRRVLSRHPSPISYLAARNMALNGEVEQADALLEALWQEHDWPLMFLPLQFWRNSIEATIRTRFDERAIATRGAAWVTNVQNRKRLVAAVLEAPQNVLTGFLRYAQTALPEIWRAIRDALAEESNRKALADHALGMSLEVLTEFLSYAQWAMPAVWRAICDLLTEEASQKRLVLLALATPLEHLPPFLRYVAGVKRVAWVRTDLLRRLLEPERRPEVLAWFEAAGPSKVSALCRQESSLDTIVAEIDAEAWRRRWGSADFGIPDWFVRFAQLCIRTNRPELAGVVAVAIVNGARPEHFLSRTVTLRHLTFILSAASDSDLKSVLGFLERCIRPGWIAASYASRDADVGPLAASVRTIAIHEEAAVRCHFRQETLFARLWKEWPGPEHDTKHCSDWLQLFAAAGLLGGSMDTPTLEPLGQPRLSAIFQLYPPAPEKQGIQPIQGWLWMGLREWVRATRERLKVDGPLAEYVLENFRAANPVRKPRLALLNTLMISWLERCRSQGWLLAIEEQSLFDALQRLESAHDGYQGTPT